MHSDERYRTIGPLVCSPIGSLVCSPVIKLNMLKTIWCNNVIRGIMDQCGTKVET